MARNPALITSEIKEGQLYERNHALSGVINRVVRGPENSQLSKPQRLFRNFMQIFRIESLTTDKFADDWAWLKIKLQVEKDLWTRFRSHFNRQSNRPDLPQTYKEYMQGILVFALTWMGTDGDEVPKFTKALPVLQTISKSDSSSLPQWAAEDPFFRKLVNFFYLHGN